MGSVWGVVTLIVIAALLLAFGIVQHASVFMALGFILMATAGIVGVRGRLPEGH